MTGFLDVDIDALSRTVQSLRGTEQTLTDVMNTMAQAGNGDIGTTTLNDACDSFQHRWKFGLERLTESARTTADGVDTCLTTYRDLDTTIATVLATTGVGAQPTPPTGSTP